MLESNYILDKLEKLYPNAHCELDYYDLYSLTIAVLLSAQTTDSSVNKATKVLFSKYPTLSDLANANFDDVYNCIKTLGLAKTKANNIINLSKMVINVYNGVIPNTMEELIKLPGIGRKCGNVILSEWFNVPSMPVDTHVFRVSKRLGLACKDDSLLEVENKLIRCIDKNRLNKAHHLLIFFGRYFCKSQNPNCIKCPFMENCVYNKEKKK